MLYTQEVWILQKGEMSRHIVHHVDISWASLSEREEFIQE